MTAMTSRLSGQFVRYLITGGVSAALEYGLFALLLKGLGWTPVHAHMLAYVVVAALNFALNRNWTFKSNGHVHKQMVYYLLLLLCNFWASSGVIFVLTAWLGIPALLAKLLVMGMVVGWNFVLYKRVIYR